MSITRNNGEVTLTFGGVEIKGTLDKELQMSKYIPKVGEEFQLSSASWSWSGNKKAAFVTPLEVIWLDDDGMTQFAVIEKTKFRPAPAKADVECELLNELIYYAKIRDTGIAEEIQKAGFTIPKKLSFEEYETIVDINNHNYGRYEALINGGYVIGDLIQD